MGISWHSQRDSSLFGFCVCLLSRYAPVVIIKVQPPTSLKQISCSKMDENQQMQSDVINELEKIGIFQELKVIFTSGRVMICHNSRYLWVLI